MEKSMESDWQRSIPVEYDTNKGATLQLHDPAVRKQLGKALLDEKATSFTVGKDEARISFDLGQSGSISRSEGRSAAPSGGFLTSGR